VYALLILMMRLDAVLFAEIKAIMTNKILSFALAKHLCEIEQFNIAHGSTVKKFVIYTVPLRSSVEYIVSALISLIKTLSIIFFCIVIQFLCKSAVFS